MNARSATGRGLGLAASLAALILFVPRAADLTERALACSVIAAALVSIGATLCLLGRVWSGLCSTVAAVSLVLAFAGLPTNADATTVAVGAAAVPLLAPLLAASVSSARWHAVAAIAAGVVAGPLHALLYDPFFDPACDFGCAHSPLAVAHHPTLAAIAEHGGAWAAAGIIVTLIPAARHRVAIAAAAIAAGSVVFGTYPVVLLVASAVVVVALAAECFAIIVVAMRLRELIATLGSSVDLQQTLRSAMNDARLSVAYSLDNTTDGDDGALVARDGSPAPSPGPEQISSVVRDEAGVLAWIRHSAAHGDVTRLAAALNGPARLAFEVERLQAVTAVHSRRVAESWARIVESGDLERRRLERDIHDGAQQFVLSVGMHIEVALLDVEPNGALRPVLEVSRARVRASLDELRAIAHGLRPFSFELAGLDAALHAVALRSDVPVTIRPLPSRRFGTESESAVLEVVRSAIDTATGPVDVDVIDRTSSIELAIAGAPASAVIARSADRVAALGGCVRGEATTVTAVIPCVS